MREGGSWKEAREFAGEEIGREELRAYRLLAALLRTFEHDPMMLPLELALKTLRSEVIARKALPIIGSSWDAANLIVPPLCIPKHRLAEYPASLQAGTTADE